MADVANIEGLTARKTGKTSRTWYYRLAVPQADQKRAGCKEIWESLRTSDKGAAITALPDAIKRAQAKLAARLSAAPPSAAAVTRTVDTVRQLSRKVSELHYRSITERDFIDRADLFEKVRADERAFFGGHIVALPETPYFGMLLEDGETPLAAYLAYYWWHYHGQRIARLRSALDAGDASEGLKTLDLHLAALNQTVTDKSTHLILSRAIISAEVDALRDITKGEEARYREPPDAKTERVPTLDQPADQGSSPLLSVCAADWITEKSRSSWSLRRTATCKATLALFLEIVGDKPISAYTKADARDFKAVLTDLPPNKPKLRETRALGAREAAKKSRELGLTKMSVVNVNKQITIMSGLFGWLGGHYDSVTFNPFAHATIATRASARDERDPFTVADLYAIFHAPVYTGCESELHWTRTGSRILRESAKFWVPLLGLYIGARLNEICKLRVADVRQEEGVCYIDINSDRHSDEKIDPQIKSAASSRRVPIHPDLVQFGFLLFVQKRRANGKERLFPELKPDCYGKLSDGFGKHFARFLQSLGIKRDKIDFHSFRHTWTDACRNSRISSDVIYALKGEALKGTLARYGDGKTDLEILDQEVRKLRFKGLDLSHLAEGSRVLAKPSPPLTELFG